MAFTSSSNMNLPIPNVGTQPGPDYATNVNDSLTLVDSHDHTPGKGVQITPEGMNINSSLDMNNNFIVSAAGVTLLAQGSTPANSTIYQSGVDLYFTDALGNDIQITANGAVGGTPGSIANLVAPASASYVSGSSKFVWQSDTNIAANMDFGAAIMRNLSPNSTFALTLQPPAALVSNYSITLPVLPVATSFMTIDSTGVISATPALVGGLTTTNISASANIIGTQLANNTITKTQLAGSVYEWNQETLIPDTPSFVVRVATTVNGTFATAFDNGSSVDGVTLATNDIILIKNQTNGAENGVYVVQASGVPSRHTDYDTFTELNNALVSVTLGTVNSSTNWYQNATLTSLSDPQTWTTSQIQEFTVPANVNQLIIEACGGGGGGGGGAGAGVSVDAGGGGGGGAGSLPRTQVFAVTPGNVLSITIGGFGRRGNAATAGGNGQDGTAGGNTKISLSSVAIMSCPGGSFGGRGNASNTAGTGAGTAGSTYNIGSEIMNVSDVPQGGAGGAIGALNVQGENGGDAYITQYAFVAADGGTGGTNSSIHLSGGGGGAGGSGIKIGGAGGHGGAGNTNNNLSAGSDPAADAYGAGGGGGGGAGRGGTRTGTLGGTGRPGVVRIYWLANT